MMAMQRKELTLSWRETHVLVKTSYLLRMALSMLQREDIFLRLRSESLEDCWCGWISCYVVKIVVSSLHAVILQTWVQFPVKVKS